QFGGGTLPCEASQSTQGHLEVASAQLLLVIVIHEFAFFPDLDGGAIAGRWATDTDTFGMVAPVAKGRGAAGANPLAAPRVTSLLLFRTFLEHLQQFVQAMLFQSGFLLGAEMTRQRFAQPIFRQGFVFGQRFQLWLV